MFEPTTYVGLDLGGSRLKLVDYRQSEDSFERVGSFPIGEADEMLDCLDSHLSELAGRKLAVSGIGIGVPGLLSPKGEVLYSPHRPELIGIELATEVASRTGIWPVIWNDAACAAAAECVKWGDRSVLVANFGTGVGSAMARSGTVTAGGNFAFGELGHTGRYSKARCACGRIGCFEETIRVMLPMGVDDDSELHLTSKSSYGDAVELIASVLHDLVLVLDPHELVLGGGLMARLDQIFEDVSVRLLAELSEHRRPISVRIHKAIADEYSGAMGAALLAARRVGYE